MEIDVSSLGTAGTMLAATFSKMGFKIKTAVSQTVRKSALHALVIELDALPYSNCQLHDVPQLLY